MLHTVEIPKMYTHMPTIQHSFPIWLSHTEFAHRQGLAVQDAGAF